MRKIITILIILWLLLNSTFADVIKNYHVDVTVLEDGRIDVVETIEVDTEFKEVKLGITREIPLNYVMANRNIETPTRIKSITRNGEVEPFRVVQKHDNNPLRTRENELLVIHIGKDDDERKNYIKYGKNVYQIHWQSYQHIRQFMDYDELYFNAIGHNWRLPIENASATIYLPHQVTIKQSASYYGYVGSTYTANSEVKTPQTIHFTAPEVLGQQKGLTIAVGFDKGLVIPQNLPPLIVVSDGMWRIQIMDVLLWIPLWMQNLIWIALAMFVYSRVVSYVIKFLYPKSQRAFTVRYHPTENLMETMALSQYYPYCDRLLTAELVDLHAKGYIQLQKKGFLVLDYMMDDVRDNNSLSSSEKRFLSVHQSFSGRQILFSKMPEDMIKDLFITPYQASLSIYYETLFENSMMKWLVVGFFVLIVSLMIGLPNGDSLAYIMMLPTFIIVHRIFYPSIVLILSSIIYKQAFIFLKSIVLVAILFAFGILGMLVILMFLSMSPSMMRSGSIVGFLSVLIMIWVSILWSLNNFLSMKILKSKFIDKYQAVLEFKHFLAYTKQDEYELLTADLFDEYLPYAIILGVEKKWIKLYQKLYPEVILQSQVIDIITSISKISYSIEGTIGGQEHFNHTVSSIGSLSGSSSSSGSFSSSSSSGSSSGSSGGGSSGGGSGGGGGGGR